MVLYFSVKQYLYGFDYNYHTLFNLINFFIFSLVSIQIYYKVSIALLKWNYLYFKVSKLKHLEAKKTQGICLFIIETFAYCTFYTRWQLNTQKNKLFDPNFLACYFINSVANVVSLISGIFIAVNNAPNYFIYLFQWTNCLM